MGAIDLLININKFSPNCIDWFNTSRVDVGKLEMGEQCLNVERFHLASIIKKGTFHRANTIHPSLFTVRYWNSEKYKSP